MWYTQSRILTFILAALLLIIAVPLGFFGCSGGDGGGSDDDRDTNGGALNGTFYGGSIYTDNFSSFTQSVFDGTADVQYSDVFNSDGDPESGSVVFSTISGGMMTGTSPDGEEMYGAYDRDRAVYALMDNNWSDGSLGINVGIKQTSGLPAGDLVSRCYRFVEYWGDSDTHIGQVCFDTATTLSFNVTDSSSPDPLDSAVSDYTLSPNGQFSLSMSGVEWAKGMISPDREFGVFTQTQLTDDVHFGAMIQFSFDLTPGHVTGTYTFFDYKSDWAAFLEITFNGDSTFTGVDLANSEDDLEVISGNYTVADNGFLSLTVTGSAETHQGMVQKDTDRIILANLNKSGTSSAGIAIGFRQP